MGIGNFMAISKEAAAPTIHLSMFPYELQIPLLAPIIQNAKGKKQQQKKSPIVCGGELSLAESTVATSD